MIAIIDYGMGNLRSVQKGFEKAGCPAFITDNPEKILEAPGVVLPGVGAFADAMQNLREAGFVDVINEVVREGKPFLGICLGMQLLFRESEENGLFQGLNILPGRVIKFDLAPGWKVPHMGWNQIENTVENPVLQGIPSGTHYYFVHSYYVVPEDLAVVSAVTEYGVSFPAVVGKGNVFGIQFHPEKSSDFGLKILKNFGGLVFR